MKTLVITDLHTIGYLLKSEREDQSLTVAELSRRSGIHVNTIWKIERCDGYPRIDVLKLLAQTLGYTQILFNL